MAAFAQASRASTPSRARQSRPPTLLRSHSSQTKILPDGSCNFRDTNLFGVNAPSCSCKHFWRNPHRPEEGVDGEVEYPWCSCGHHACFHEQSTSRAASPVTDLVEVQPGVYVQADRLKSESGNRLNQADHGQFFTPRRRGEFTRSLSGDTTVDDGQHTVQDFVVPTAEHNSSPGLRKETSGPHGSGLPSIPSMCQLNSREFQFDSNFHSNANDGTRSSMRGSSQRRSQQRTPMSMPSPTNDSNHMPPPEANPFETEALKEWHRTVGQPREGSLIASTVRYSTDVESERPRNSPSRAFLEGVLQARRAAAQTPAQSTPIKSEGVFQSTTELAAPSIANTPELQAYDQHIQEAHSLIDDVVREMASAEDEENTANQGNEAACSPTQPNTSQVSSRAPSNKTLTTRAESESSLQRYVPSALRKLAPQLLALQKHLASQPSISTTMRNISDRLWMLENASFQHVPAEEINDKFELMDGRILDAEYRLNELEQQYNMIQEEKEERANAEPESSQEAMAGHKAITYQILDQDNKYARISEIEQRLEDLEAAVPSDANPWEIEVVLLPWGRDLHGVWYTQDELDNLPHCNYSISESSQQSDNMQFRRRRSSSSLSRSKDIQLSSGTDEEQRLYPRACGSKGKVWYRLKSRGLIKTVTIREPAARHILTAIAEAFGDHVLESETNDSQLTEDSEMTDTPDDESLGLRAPVVPLRKIRRDPQLLFLGPSEMVTPSLWNAQFLSSGMIHFASGKRRLFVTTKEAYHQSSNESLAWTWQSIRALPRVPIHLPAEIDAHVTEDSEEPWWLWDPQYDASDVVSAADSSDNSQSSDSSFSSSNSLPMRTSTEKSPSSRFVSIFAGHGGQESSRSQPLPPRPPRSLKRTVSAPTTQVSTSTRRTKRSADEGPLSDSDEGYSVAQAALSIHRDSIKRRRTSRSLSNESIASQDADDTAAGSARYFNEQNPTPRPTPTTEQAFSYLAQGGEVDLRKLGASANWSKGVSRSGSDAYNTPASYSPRTRPPPFAPDFSDTEPDSDVDDASDNSEDAGTEVDDDAAESTRREVRDKKRAPRTKPDLEAGGDEEMTDAHDEWNGISSLDNSQDAGSVDLIKHRSDIKQEDDDALEQTMYAHPKFRPPVALPRYTERGGRV